MSGKISTSGTLTLKSVGKTGLSKPVEGIDAVVSSSTKRTFGGVEVSLKAVEGYTNSKQSTVATLTASKKIAFAKGSVTPTLTTSTSNIKNVDAQLVVQQATKGGEVDVKGTWAFRKATTTIDIVSKPVNGVKMNLQLLVPYQPKLEKLAQTASITYEKNGFTFQPSYSFVKKATTLSLSKKIDKSTLKTTYGINDEALSLSYAMKPFTITTKTTAGKGKIGWPTLSLLLEGDIAL